ncbi:hypothetical protein AYK21_01240 [Thermoplasmatales archaeon SG8-52-2]|nr:MAG: hypothetical protein AYK21_01240 [Thermoplasmatales archaeon SG8-52-2]
MTPIENVKDAILTAIQMEKDGYAFYTKAAAQTQSDMGRTIFESLAADEQRHLDVFQKMFEENLVKNMQKFRYFQQISKMLLEWILIVQKLMH